MAKSKITATKLIIIAILGGMWFLSFHKMMLAFTNDMLEKYAGMTDPLMQQFTFVVIIGVLLAIFAGKSIDDLIRKR